mmetsp:Transcript_67864/g.153582  ORF Transcript_67864/g.153582 Transcript_67864/m.153582 type:complete len:236 (-) Transcript_67864:181-888(-)
MSAVVSNRKNLSRDKKTCSSSYPCGPRLDRTHHVREGAEGGGPEGDQDGPAGHGNPHVQASALDPARPRAAAAVGRVDSERGGSSDDEEPGVEEVEDVRLERGGAREDDDARAQEAERPGARVAAALDAHLVSRRENEGDRRGRQPLEPPNVLEVPVLSARELNGAHSRTDEHEKGRQAPHDEGSHGAQQTATRGGDRDHHLGGSWARQRVPKGEELGKSLVGHPSFLFDENRLE